MEAVATLLKIFMGLTLVHFQKYWLLKVRQSRKQIRTFLGRIEETINCFRDLLTFTWSNNNKNKMVKIRLKDIWSLRLQTRPTTNKILQGRSRFNKILQASQALMQRITQWIRYSLKFSKILNSFSQRSRYISIKFPLHKQSENPTMCY